MLLGRPLVTLLPSHSDPGLFAQRQRLEERRDAMKRHHDQTSGSDLPPLYVGQRVRVRSHVDKTWFPATVSEKCNEPRSYIVSTPNGRQLRRNRGQLRELEPRPTQDITRFAKRTGDPTTIVAFPLRQMRATFRLTPDLVPCLQLGGPRGRGGFQNT